MNKKVFIGNIIFCEKVNYTLQTLLKKTHPPVSIHSQLGPIFLTMLYLWISRTLALMLSTWFFMLPVSSAHADAICCYCKTILHKEQLMKNWMNVHAWMMHILSNQYSSWILWSVEATSNTTCKWSKEAKQTVSLTSMVFQTIQFIKPFSKFMLNSYCKCSLLLVVTNTSKLLVIGNNNTLCTSKYCVDKQLCSSIRENISSG